MFKRIHKNLDFYNWASDSSFGENSNFPLGENTFKEENCYYQRIDYSVFETKDGINRITFLNHRQLYSLKVSV